MTVDPKEVQLCRLRAYSTAQKAMASLRSAVYSTLAFAGETGMRNVDIGRALGIYGGHDGHEGHISRTLLAMMEAEGVVRQHPRTKHWHLADVLQDD